MAPGMKALWPRAGSACRTSFACAPFSKPVGVIATDARIYERASYQPGAQGHSAGRTKLAFVPRMARTWRFRKRPSNDRRLHVEIRREAAHADGRAGEF